MKKYTLIVFVACIIFFGVNSSQARAIGVSLEITESYIFDYTRGEGAYDDRIFMNVDSGSPTEVARVSLRDKLGFIEDRMGTVSYIVVQHELRDGMDLSQDNWRNVLLVDEAKNIVMSKDEYRIARKNTDYMTDLFSYDVRIRVLETAEDCMPENKRICHPNLQLAWVDDSGNEQELIVSRGDSIEASFIPQDVEVFVSDAHTYSFNRINQEDYARFEFITYYKEPLAVDEFWGYQGMLSLEETRSHRFCPYSVDGKESCSLLGKWLIRKERITGYRTIEVC